MYMIINFSKKLVCGICLLFKYSNAPLNQCNSCWDSWNVCQHHLFQPLFCQTQKTPVLILLTIKHTWPLSASVNTTFLPWLPCHPLSWWCCLFIFLTYTEHSILDIFVGPFSSALPIAIFKFWSWTLFFISIYTSSLDSIIQFQDFKYCVCNPNAKLLSQPPKSKLVCIKCPLSISINMFNKCLYHWGFLLANRTVAISTGMY